MQTSVNASIQLKLDTFFSTQKNKCVGDANTFFDIEKKKLWIKKLMLTYNKIQWASYACASLQLRSWDYNNLVKRKSEINNRKKNTKHITKTNSKYQMLLKKIKHDTFFLKKL